MEKISVKMYFEICNEKFPITFCPSNQINPYNSHWWPSQNFSLKYQYNIEKTSGKNKEKYVLGDYFLDPIPNSPKLHHKNVIADRKENH